jgi:hypothetical protein
MTMVDRLTPKLTYANVTATLALFVALGGTSYAAAKLPRDSVGATQIRAGAVRSSEVRNGSLTAGDLSLATRRALAGRQGPVGPAGPAGPASVRSFAAVEASGRPIRGNATNGGRTGVGTYEIGFAAPVEGCAFTATVGSTDASAPPAGRATVRDAGGRIGVQTFDAAGSPADLPFHIIVGC